MSDTPRTNKAQFPADIFPRCPAGYQEQVVYADFARELELENAELLEALNNLTLVIERTREVIAKTK